MRKFTFLLMAAMLFGLFANAQKTITPASAEGTEIWSPAKNTIIQDRALNKGTEDFEGNFLPFGWSETAIEKTWFRSTSATFQITGLSAVIGQTVNSPEEMLITPPLTLDGTVTTISYHAAGVNNNYGFGSSSLVLKYKLVGTDTWTVLGDAIDFANGEGDTLLERDLSGLADGNYYFAFAASSTFDYGTYTSYVLIDDVIAPDPMGLNTITFNLTDGTDPIAGSSVTFGDQTRTTDATGVAIFGLLDGTYDWETSTYGYYDETGSETIAADATVDVVLGVMPVVTFNVTDGTDPLEGVTITIEDGQIVTTDETGEATASLDDGTYEYTASLTAYIDVTGSITISGADISETVTMTMKPVYTVTFNVTDGTDALEGATIVIAEQTLTTDATGVATIDLYDGDWAWTASLVTYIDVTGAVTVAGVAIEVPVAMELMPTEGIINTDDFESYTAGDLVGATSDYWETWSGPDGGGADDALISSTFALSGDNSLNIAVDKDMVYPLGDKTSGKYIVSYYLLIEAGNEGYYNFQRTAAPGDKWMYDVYFDGDGSGRLAIDGTDTATFVYPEGKWFYVNQIIDLDNDRASLNIDSELVLSWMYSQDGAPENIQLGGINFYGAANVNYYLDDIEYNQMVFTDDFESYTAGTLVAESSDYWKTWTSEGGTADDALVSTDNARSGLNSMFVGDGGADDMIFPLGDKTSGKYYVAFNMLVPEGDYDGYYNFQHMETPGEEWAFDVWLNPGGTGHFDAAGEVTPFSYTQNTWISLAHYIDLDNDEANFYLNGELIYTWQYSLQSDGEAGANQLGGIDFYAGTEAAAVGEYYIDDIVYGQYTWLPAEIVGTTTYFSVTTMDSEPIENATILVNGETITTDATGMASAILFDGTYNYTITHPNYVPIESSVVVAGVEQTVANMMVRVYNVTFNVDMTLANNPENSRVWITGGNADGVGAIGNNSVWPLPGGYPAFKMLDPEEDMTYTLTVPSVLPGDYEYRYHWTLGPPTAANGFPIDPLKLEFTVVEEDVINNDVWQPTGINNTEEKNFNLYPNPTNGIAKITIDGAGVIVVSNMIGQTILTQEINNNYDLDMSGQNAGLYFVTARTNNGVATLRLVVE